MQTAYDSNNALLRSVPTCGDFVRFCESDHLGFVQLADTVELADEQGFAVLNDGIPVLNDGIPFAGLCIDSGTLAGGMVISTIENVTIANRLDMEISSWYRRLWLSLIACESAALEANEVA